MTCNRFEFHQATTTTKNNLSGERRCTMGCTTQYMSAVAHPSVREFVSPPMTIMFPFQETAGPVPPRPNGNDAHAVQVSVS